MEIRDFGDSGISCCASFADQCDSALLAILLIEPIDRLTGAWLQPAHYQLLTLSKRYISVAIRWCALHVHSYTEAHGHNSIIFMPKCAAKNGAACWCSCRFSFICCSATFRHVIIQSHRGRVAVSLPFGACDRVRAMPIAIKRT